MHQGLAFELNNVMPAARATGLFASLVTFKDRPGGATPTVNAMGQVDLTNLVNVTGLVNIPCQIAPEKMLNPDVGAGVRMPDKFEERPTRHLLLNDYYPAVLPRFVAVVDGTSYEITPGTVEHDSQHQQTRLAVRRFSL